MGRGSPAARSVTYRGSLGITGPYVWFCRFAAFVFMLVALYTVAVKGAAADLSADWVHTVLHLLTAALAVHLGWIRPGRPGSRLYTWGVAIGYGLLGGVGWMVDGIAMGTPFRIPLTAADNLFHLLLAVVAVVVGVRAER